MLPVACKCYNPENGYPSEKSDGHVDLWSHGIFLISDTRNMFVVLGCNTGAFTMNFGEKRGGRYKHQYYAGCFTTAACPGAPRTAGAPASAAATSTSRRGSRTPP